MFEKIDILLCDLCQSVSKYLNNLWSIMKRSNVPFMHGNKLERNRSAWLYKKEREREKVYSMIFFLNQ